MSAASSESNVDDCHRHSLTVEPINPMHLIASGKGNRRFSTQAEAECQKRLMKKFSITSEEQKDVYSAAVADKLEDQENLEYYTKKCEYTLYVVVRNSEVQNYEMVMEGNRWIK
ncbi:Transcription factor [Dirofilaria immitis]